LKSTSSGGVLDNTTAPAAAIATKLDVGLSNLTSRFHQGVEIIVGYCPRQVANVYRSAASASPPRVKASLEERWIGMEVGKHGSAKDEIEN
jgi:hypothetical protein